MFGATVTQKPSSFKRRVSTFFGFQAAGFGYMAIQGDDINWICVLISLIFGGFARAKREEYNLEMQIFRDEEASGILQNPGRGTYWLYLRPFRVTGKIELRNLGKDQGPLTPWYYERADTVEFEELLQAAVAQVYHGHISFMGLGRPREAIGAGRAISPDETWKENIEKLVPEASKILVIPGTTESVRWEMDLLHRMDALQKTIFILPPVTGEMTAEMRADALEALKLMGIQGLGAVGESGALIRLGHDLVNFDVLTDYGIAAALERIAP